MLNNIAPLKDTHREKAASNKTLTLSKSMNMDIWVLKSMNMDIWVLKSMNMDIWVVGTSNQLFKRRS